MNVCVCGDGVRRPVTSTEARLVPGSCSLEYKQLSVLCIPKVQALFACYSDRVTNFDIGQYVFIWQQLYLNHHVSLDSSVI